MSKVRRAFTRCIAMLAMCLAPAASPAHTAAFAIATAPYTYHFPRDHAAHNAYQTEWWYYTGHVTDATGRPFGFELTFFRVGLAPGDTTVHAAQSPWRGNQIYPAHFALTDILGKQFFFDERLAREGKQLGGADERRLAVHTGDWTLQAQADGTMHLHAASGVHRLDLTLTSEKPPAIHGTGGITKKGNCRSCASHYYSMTRLRAVGRIAVDGMPLNVRGQAWMDHEFGSSQLESNQVGWDWFSFQFNDNREVMFYRLRTQSHEVSPQSSGSLIKPNGHVVALMRNDLACTVVSTWTSLITNAVYPSMWHCRIAKMGLDFRVVPRLANQELAGQNPGSLAYWEGDVALVDDQSRREIGTGYVELTGYSSAIRL